MNAKIALVCKSDSIGGAAVVTRRLMHALRRQGADARLFVAEKLSDDPFVFPIASKWKIRTAFLAERLKIFLRNGLSRKTLFKIDTASDGIDISHIPFIRHADAVLLNWVNQGTLSLNDISELHSPGKTLLWTMHDMWNFTGICHHAGSCKHYLHPSQCEDCPLLPSEESPGDLSHSTLLRKERLYSQTKIKFVAVSTWLADLAGKSTLLRSQELHVIPNPFPFDENDWKHHKPYSKHSFTLLFGAARLDDPIKDLDSLIKILEQLKARHPEIARKTTLELFGGIKNEEILRSIPIKWKWHGMISSPERIKELFAKADAVISTSRYETLPTTLVEAQAYGAVPVSSLSGGQADIVSHLSTGFLAPRLSDSDEDLQSYIDAMTRGIVWAHDILENEETQIRHRMAENVRRKFSEEAVARKYLALCK